MTEINKAALAQETRLIEYWRKKYLFQAAAVAVCAGAAIAAAAIYIQAKLPALLIILAVLTVAYLMLRELRDSLQTRGETLIFAKDKALFDGVDFDYGQGIDKDEALFGMWAFDARECRGVMSGRGFSLEEDWLYKAVSARFFMLKLTVFEGILLVVDNGEGSMPDAAALIRNAGVHGAAEKMRRLLGAETMRAAVSGGRAVFYFKTKNRLFHQFALERTNTTGIFVRRVEALKAQAEETAAAVRGAADAVQTEAQPAAVRGAAQTGAQPAAVQGAADAVKTGAQPAAVQGAAQTGVQSDSDERRGSADGSSGDGGCGKVGG